MNKMRNILLTGVLSIGLIIMSLPAELLAREPEEAQGEIQEEIQEEVPADRSEETLKEAEEDLQEEQLPLFEITAFEELPEDVCRQHVLLGTSIEELNLPDTLTVSGGYVSKEAGENSDKSGEEESGTEDKPGTEDSSEEEEPEAPDVPDAEDSSGEEEPETPDVPDTEDSSEEEQPGTPDVPDTEDGSGEEETETPDVPGTEEGSGEEEPEAPDVPGAEDGAGERKPDTSGTETGRETKTGEENGAAKREAFAVKTVHMPMKQYYAQPQYAVAADVLVSENTEGTFTETRVIEEVLWTSMPAYDGETEGVYLFTPILPEGYRIGDSVTLPEITLFVGGEELALVSETETENRIIIDEDTEWYRTTTLENCTVVIEEGVTLKIYNDRVMVKGNVIIEGGGKIITGDTGELGMAFIYVDSGAVLTMRNITVDGEHRDHRMPIVHSYGKVILDAGCRIMNLDRSNVGSFLQAYYGSEVEINGAEISDCTSGYGGFLYGVEAKIVINGATVSGCKAANGGGFFSVKSTQITINDIDIKDCEAEQGGVFYLEEGSKAEVYGGTIQNCKAARGGAFYARQGTSMEIHDVTINGCSASDSGGAICVFTAYVRAYDSYLDIHNAVIENCSANNSGGAIAVYSSTSADPLTPSIYYAEVFVTIEDGLFRNNSTSAAPNASVEQGGGCIYNEEGYVSIKGGEFIGNTAANRGGCIFHSGLPTVTSLYGGIFDGNRCTEDAYQGSGAVYISSMKAADSYLFLSEGVLFRGDGIEGSGTDGIYLDSQTEPRRIWLRGTLNEPATVYVKAVEGYAIAEGADGHVLSRSEDIPKVKFINIGNDPGPWYSVLDEENNQIRLSKTKPQYKVAVRYDSNGAEGTVEDDDNNGAGYVEGDTVTVRSAEILSLKGHHFIGWNTKADGKGTYYYAGDTIDITEEITSDIYLYAIFEKDKNSKKPEVKKESEIKTGEFKAYVQTAPEASKERLQEYPQPRPADNEPDTGDDSTRMEVYVITAMIAWMYYLLLRMTTGKNGITEEEKQEMTARIISWGRKGKKGRRLLALAAVLWIIFYYHSIGKRTDAGWMEAYGA